MMSKANRQIMAWVLLSLAIFLVMITKSRVYAANYSVKGHVYTVKAKKNTDIGAVVNKSIGDASKKASSSEVYTVKVKKGTYKLGRAINMRSNVKLDMRGVTVKCISNQSNMLCAYNTNSKKTGGYKAASNIAVIGGKWKANKKSTACIMRIAHCKNVSLKGCVFDGGYALHQVETAAIDGLSVEKCTFKNMRSGKTVKNGEKLEALQLDLACSSNSFHGYYMDGTPTKNVTVKDCSFLKVPRGIGSHIWLKGQYLENVVIENNRFEDLEEEAIIALNYSHCKISKNVISNCGAGILFQSAKSSANTMYSTYLDGKKNYLGSVKDNMDAEIFNNYISVIKNNADETAGIKIYGRIIDIAETGADGKKISGDFPACGVFVHDNDIVCQGVGLHLYYGKDCSITRNTIQEKSGGKTVSAIMLEKGCSDIDIDFNTIDDSVSCGILVEDVSACNSIMGNTITDSGSSAIRIDNSTVSRINENVIYADDKTYACTDGILIYNGATVGEVFDNTISDMSGRSIKVTGGGSVDDLGINNIDEGSIYYG